MRRWIHAGITSLLVASTVPMHTQLLAQTTGAARLQQLVRGLSVTPRVLILGAHPDDEDSQLIAWLARGRMVETGYLSLTRGEGGQNFVGTERGVVLGAARTEEVLAARRIDGGVQFFTRAFDFGDVRTAEKAFSRWPHEQLLGDVVAVIRSFRPQLLVTTFADSVGDGNGQHAALMVLAREAYAAAADTARFPVKLYGHPWAPLKLYTRGGSLAINTGEYDPVLGKTYADVAAEARSAYRTQGFPVRPVTRDPVVRLARAQSRVDEETGPADERSLFDGIDTSLTRLVAGAPTVVARTLPLLVAYADSARVALDLRRPARVVRYLAHAAELAAAARVAAPHCGHPSPDVAVVVNSDTASLVCDSRAADLDASIDLVQERASHALLLAAGVSFDATVDREFIADGDRARVTVRMFNHGDSTVTLGDVVVSNAPRVLMTPVVVLPDSVARVDLDASTTPRSGPWWSGTRSEELFPVSGAFIDGLARGAGTVPDMFLAPSGIVVPEGMRRLTDVTVTVTVAGTAITTSLGPLVVHHADPIVGAQDRAVSGVPAVTLSFPRALEWIRANKPIDRQLRLTIKSFADSSRNFALRIVAPGGVRVDSIPSMVALAPREERELFLHLRGRFDSGRSPFGVVGRPTNGELYVDAFEPVQYSYLRPLHFFHSSGFWLQAVNTETPAQLNVVYVAGVSDDIPASLRQIGIPVHVVTVDELLSLDLSNFTTVVLGPRAYELQQTLAGQNARLLEFVRRGGTLVMLQDTDPEPGKRVIPYPMGVGRFKLERVDVPSAHVTVLEPRSRLLNWPNTIGEDDWANWVSARAVFVPSHVDPRYSTVLEMHDPGEPENRNTLLSASIGKGKFIYTTLSLQDQIPLGVPGSLRLLVNLLSAGLSPATAR